MKISFLRVKIKKLYKPTCPDAKKKIHKLAVIKVCGKISSMSVASHCTHYCLNC